MDIHSLSELNQLFMHRKRQQVDSFKYNVQCHYSLSYSLNILISYFTCKTYLQLKSVVDCDVCKNTANVI